MRFLRVPPSSSSRHILQTINTLPIRFHAKFLLFSRVVFRWEKHAHIHLWWPNIHAILLLLFLMSLLLLLVFLLLLLFLKLHCHFFGILNNGILANRNRIVMNKYGKKSAWIMFRIEHKTLNTPLAISLICSLRLALSNSLDICLRVVLCKSLGAYISIEKQQENRKNKNRSKWRKNEWKKGEKCCTKEDRRSVSIVSHKS